MCIIYLNELTDLFTDLLDIPLNWSKFKRTIDSNNCTYQRRISDPIKY